MSEEVEQRVSDALSTAISACSPAGRLVVAYSGGLDSHVLLHALALSERAGRLQNKLLAVHVNHHLQAQSNDWCDHCRRVAASLDIPFDAIDVSASAKTGESPEDAARVARYNAFAGMLERDDKLLTGHHADDQTETVLLQLLRGAGVSGLAGMPAIRALGAGSHLRPFLNLTRDMLRHYALQMNLQWIDDPSNQSDRYARNYLRKHVLPALRARWPALQATSARSAQNCADSARLNAELAVLDSKHVVDNEGRIEITLLRQFKVVRQRNIVRHWLQQTVGQFPPRRILDEIFTCVLPARADSGPCIAYGGHTIRRYRGHVYLVPDCCDISPDWCIAWSDTDTDLTLPELGVALPASFLTDAVGSVTTLAPVTVRLRRGGESICLPGRGTKTLKALFQELRVPPWTRARLPLVYCGDELIAVYGLDKYLK